MPTDGRPPEDTQGTLLFSVFALLEASGVPDCVLHGADALPGGVTSDVDCIMPPEVVPRKLTAILQQHRSELRGAVVQWLQHEATAHYLVLATEDDQADPKFLALDVSSDYRRNGRVYYSGRRDPHVTPASVRTSGFPRRRSSSAAIWSRRSRRAGWLTGMAAT